MVVFMIVGKSNPLYELTLTPPASAVTTNNNSTNADQLSELAYLHQFILHSSLDMVQTSMWLNNATFLKVVDRFNSLLISSYVTPGGAILLLLHNGKHEDAVRAFFVEVHDMYVKYLMNPFSKPDEPILSPQFDLFVRNIAKRILSV